MTRSIPDDNPPGSAEEARRDAEQYAADACTDRDEVAAALAAGELGGALVLATQAMQANTSALLATAARIGQWAATQGQAARPPNPDPQLARVGILAATPVRHPEPTRGGPSGAWVRDARELSRLAGDTVILDADRRAWQLHDTPDAPRTWKSVTHWPGEPFGVLTLTDGVLAARDRGPFLVLWRPGVAG